MSKKTKTKKKLLRHAKLTQSRRVVPQQNKIEVRKVPFSQTLAGVTSTKKRTVPNYQIPKNKVRQIPRNANIKTKTTVKDLRKAFLKQAKLEAEAIKKRRDKAADLSKATAITINQLRSLATEICEGRKERKEVLLASGKGGKNYTKKIKDMIKSKVRC